MTKSPGETLASHADAADIPALIAFLYEHGVNEWNHLPEGPITAHLNRIADGAAQAVLAECAGKLIGFVSSEIGGTMARYQPDARRTEPHGIIHEAVVHRDHVGQGIGSQLLAAWCNGSLSWVAAKSRWAGMTRISARRG